MMWSPVLSSKLNFFSSSSMSSFWLGLVVGESMTAGMWSEEELGLEVECSDTLWWSKKLSCVG